MEKLTKVTLAAKAVHRWREKYLQHIGTGSDKEEILIKLQALGTSPTPEEVNTTIGNDSWVQVPECSECDNKHPSLVIRVGEEEDCESMTAYLCEECIGKLGEILNEKP